MLNQILSLLNRQGYLAYGKEKPGIYIHETEEMVYIITISRFRRGMHAEEYQRLQQQTEFLVASKYQKAIQTLHLIITENGMFDTPIMQMLEKLSNLWLIAEDTGKIYIFENQIADFDNLYDILVDGLREARRRKKKQSSFAITPVNMVIVALNILVFVSVILINGGYYAVYNLDIMLKMGAMSYETVKSGAWYQLVTSMFLHFGLSHLASNMVLLTYAGCELESRIGSICYLILYMLSGIVGNVVSFFYYGINGQTTVSAGASGAVFGVTGALFAVLLVNRTKTENLSTKRLLFLIIIEICYGLTTAGIDNAAHIGGFLSGIIGGFLLSKISQYVKLE